MRVAIYARVSSEDQAERGTIENQIEFAAKYCDLHQLEIIDWYKDDGVTGTIPLEQRPEGRRLLEDAQAGRFELLLMYRLDRLGRSARIILNAVYDLEQYGIKIQGYSTVKVADYLNALGVPPSYTKDGRQIKRGKRKVNTAGIWRPARIRNMIVNTTYKGIHYYGKRTEKKRELIPREVPAIVSKEIWEKAQQVLRENQLEAIRNAKREYLLRGLIKCGVCGLTYHGTAFPGPERKPKAYYVCGGKTSYRGPLQGKCTSKNIPAEWIENLVWQECVNFIENPGEAT